MLLSLLLACADPTPAPWGARRSTVNQHYQVALSTLPDPVVRGELFSVQAVVTGLDAAPVVDAKVVIDARMPQHGHGMMTAPRPVEGDHAGGVYRSDGFTFHMAGEWTLTVDVDGPAGPDRTQFVYALP